MGQPKSCFGVSSDVNTYAEGVAPVTNHPVGDFHEFYEANWLSMVRLAVLLTGDTTHAEDATQEAFLAAHRQWSRFGVNDSPRGYVRGAVVNQCRKVASSRLVLWRKAPLLAQAESTHEPHELVGPQFDMWQAVQRLPRRMREVVVLRFYEDCDTRATAQLLGISEGTVKSATAKALKKLSATVTLKDQS